MPSLLYDKQLNNNVLNYKIMTRKENLLKEVYLLKNRTAEMEGKQTIDIDAYSQGWRFRDEAAKSKVYELESRIESSKKSLAEIIEQKRVAEARDAYFATPEGAAHKARLEGAIETKSTAWKQTEQQLISDIENRLHHTLGAHWGVCGFTNYSDCCTLCIGIIDAEKSTEDHRVFIFGQTTDIRYSARSWCEERERLEINIGTCGSCSLIGGESEGEYSRFYIGIGFLFADKKLIQWLHDTMRDGSRSLNTLVEEMDALREQLKNPTAGERV